MNGLYRIVLTVNDALHVHQAAAVAARDVGSARTHVVLDLVPTHADTDLGLLDRVHPPEAAALIDTLRLDDLDAVDELEEVTDLVHVGEVTLTGRREVKLAYPVAAVVDADAVREAAGQGADLEVIVQELDDVAHAAWGLAAVLPGEDMAIVLLDEGDTAGRGADDDVEALKELLEASRKVLGLVLIARIGHGLATAGLVQRIHYVMA